MPAKYFSLPSLGSSTATMEDPAQWPPEIPMQLDFPTKEDYRKWCIDPTTSWLFYSVVEAINPALRPSLTDNPAHILHGFVADFDGDGIDVAKLVEKASKIVDRPRPTWVTETYSHKARVIWEFEVPVQLSDDPKYNEKLLKAIAKELQVEKLAPGLDPGSYSPTTYWEIGRAWHQIGGLTKRDTLLSVWLSLVDKMKYAASDKGEAVIPIETVVAALETRYPYFRGRWTGPFEPGARGPLFWVNDGIDRVGCVVTDGGVRCFSTRSAKGFMSWQDLLGFEFVKAYKQKRLGEAAGDAYYESSSGDYCLKVNSGWRKWGKDDMIMRLKVAGISHKTGKGSTCTEAEQVLVMIQENRSVDASGPFLFNPNPVVEFNGMTFLNTAFGGKVMKPNGDPDPANFPWLAEFFENVFDDRLINNCRPVDFFFAWLQRFWRAGINHVPKLGQIVVLAGKPSKGKSFTGIAMLRKIMGGAVDASNYLLDGRGFNKELGTQPVWNVDDSKSTASFTDHKRFSEMLKKHTASPDLIFQPKYTDAITVPWYGRIFITCNDDSDSLAILPTLDGSILDKLMLFKCHPTWTANFGTLAENNAMLDRELPHFLAWLDQWEPPAGVIDNKNPRYGVLSYHHPDLVDAARDSSPDYRFVEILEAWRGGAAALVPNGQPKLWEGSCTDLIRAIILDPSLAPLMRSYSPISVGRIMAKLGYWKPLLRFHKSGGLTKYHIDLAMVWNPSSTLGARTGP